MSQIIKTIEIENWKRKPQYDYFGTYSFPICSISSVIDVTDLIAYCKKNRLKFFSVFLHTVSVNINRIEEFRTRLDDGRIVVYDSVDPSYVIINDKSEIFTCRTAHDADMLTFYQKTREDIECAKACTSHPEFNPSILTDCFYVSCLPWIDIRAVINPYNISNLPQTVIPRIAWGKYSENASGRMEMGFDVSVHHAFVDGFQISELINGIQNDINTIYGGQNNEG